MTTQQEVMPREFLLTAPPTIPQARSYLFKQQTELQEYDVTKGNRVRINIPRLQNTYLTKDSYLRFTLNIDASYPGGVAGENSNTPGLNLDRCGAFGLFDRLEVYDYLGGTLIEQVNNLPALMTLLMDLEPHLQGPCESLYGIRPPNIVGTDPTLDPSTVAWLNQDGGQLWTSNSGKILLHPGWTDSTFRTVEFAIPLPSFLGLFSDKYVPLHNGFSIDLFLNSTANAFVSRIEGVHVPALDDGQPYFSLDAVWISNVELCCQVIELGTYAETLLQASEPWVVPCRQYRHFSTLVRGGGEDSNFRLDMNLNVVSLRKLYFIQQPTQYTNNLIYPAYGHRIRNYLENFTFQYGSSYLPEIAGVNCRRRTLPVSRNGYAFPGSIGADEMKASMFTQAYQELIKTTGHKRLQIKQKEFWIDTGFASNAVEYNSTDIGLMVPWGPAATEYGRCGKFVGALNFMLSPKDAVCGIDTNGLLVSLNGTYSSEHVVFMQQANVHAWAEHDAFVQVIPGVATTVTF